MANLDQLEQKVDDLNAQTNSIFKFNAAFRDIQEAARTTADAEVPRLEAILSTFRGKLPDLVNYKRLQADVRDLAETLMLGTLSSRIARIRERNEALSSLTSDLKDEIDKANSDATRLKRIKEAVEKATKTVEEVKELIDALTATDASTKDRLKALADALDDISSIFDPEEEEEA